jgi:hypothetical protein
MRIGRPKIKISTPLTAELSKLFGKEKSANNRDRLRVVLLAIEGQHIHEELAQLGLSGEFIRQLIDSGRYEKQASKLPGLDYIFVRYGRNDMARREDFEANFPKDYHELLAMLIPMSVIPVSEKINKLIH